MTKTTMELDVLPQAGHEGAICETLCWNCGDGMRFDQQQCNTCGETPVRYRRGA